MSAVTIADLEEYLGVDLDAGQEARAQMVLDGLQGELEAFLGRPVGVQSFTDDYDWTGDDNLLSLRQTPVAAVASVTAVTILDSGATTDTIEVDYYTVTQWGLTGLSASARSRSPYILRVVYTAGFDLDEPRYAGLRFAILKAAQRWYHSDGDDGAIAESAGGAIKALATDGGYSVQFTEGGPLSGGSAGVGTFMPGELEPFKRFKRKG